MQADGPSASGGKPTSRARRADPTAIVSPRAAVTKAVPSGNIRARAACPYAQRTDRPKAEIAPERLRPCRPRLPGAKDARACRPAGEFSKAPVMAPGRKGKHRRAAKAMRKVCRNGPGQFRRRMGAAIQSSGRQGCGAVCPKDHLAQTGSGRNGARSNALRSVTKMRASGRASPRRWCRRLGASRSPCLQPFAAPCGRG